MQVLPPGVEHCQEADGGAQQSRVCCRFQQRLSSGAEQDVVDRSRILKRQVSNLLRQCKDHMEIGDGEKLGLSLREPPGASRSLALGAMPIAAGVI